MLMFGAGIAAVGITHQTAWLLTAPEPILQGGFRESVRRIHSGNNLKNIGLALHDYDDKYSHFPPGGTFDSQGRMMHSWQTAILPYVEQDKLYARIHHDLPWDHPDNAAAFKTPVPYYYVKGDQTHDADGFALSHYAANVRVLGAGEPTSLTRLVAGPGLTVTPLAGEAAGNYKPWGYPANWRDPALGINRSPDGFGDQSRRGANILFADGSVRYLTNEMSPEIVQALAEAER
jgi:prepilin-type processing-associated H-X9-DG protein